jgi:hypothetical protein
MFAFVLQMDCLTMSIPSKTLRSLLGLTEKRDALINELQKIEAAITSAFSGTVKDTAVATKRGRKPGRKAQAPKTIVSKVVAPAPAKKTSVAKSVKSKAAVGAKRGKRGALKEQIIAALKEAGTKGIGVKDISSKLGVKSANIHVWFGTTGKTVGVEKVSPGVYRLK